MARMCQWRCFLSYFLAMLCGLGLVLSEEHMPSSLNVGVIMPLDSASGRESQLGLELALEEINSNASILNGTKLVLKYGDSKNDAYHAARATRELFEANVIALLGLPDSRESQFIAHAATTVNVPVISFLNTGPFLSRDHYQFFTRVAFSELKQMAAVASLVKYYGWNEVITLFKNDDSGNIAVQQLAKELKVFGCKISFEVFFGQDTDTKSAANELLKVKNSKSGIFILHVQGAIGFKILSAAYSLGMLTEGFSWIVTDDITNILDRTSYYAVDMSREMQGIIGLRAFPPGSLKTGNFKRKLESQSRNQQFQDELSADHVSVGYDALWILANAINMLSKEKRKFSFVKSSLHSFSNNVSSIDHARTYLTEIKVFKEGNALLNHILQTKFTGVTGNIELDSSGYRANPVFEVVNFVGRGSRTVGYWLSVEGLQRHHPHKFSNCSFGNHSGYLALEDVIWPGGTAKPPSGRVAMASNRKLRIAVPHKLGFTEFVSVSVDKNGNWVYDGLCIDVFTSAVAHLAYNISYEFTPVGNKNTNPKYDDLPQLVADKEFDAAVGDIDITANRSAIVDFTLPFISSGLVVVVPERNYSPRHMWAFLKIVSPCTICVIVAFALLTGTVRWFIKPKEPTEKIRGGRSRIAKMLSFIVFTSFLQESESGESIRSSVVLYVWMLVLIIISRIYIAYLTSLLTVKNVGPTINGISALLNSDDPIGYQSGSFVKNYLCNLGVKESRLIPLDNTSSYAAALYKGPNGGHGGVAAIVDELPYVQVFLSSNCVFETNGQLFREAGWGFAFPKGSSLAKDLSTAVSILSDNGELQRIHSKWVEKSQCSSEADSTKLDTSAFWGAFMVTGLVSLLAVICHLSLELYWFQRTVLESEAQIQQPRSNIRTCVSSFIVFLFQSEEAFADEEETEKQEVLTD